MLFKVKATFNQNKMNLGLVPTYVIVRFGIS